MSDKPSAQVFLTPIAIIVAGIIVAVGIVGKDQIQARLGGTKPSVAGDTAANANQNNTPPAQQQQQPAEPSLAGVTESIPANAIIGNKDAKVTVISFSDFACPYCAAANGQNQSVMDSLKNQITDWEAPIPNIIKDYVDTGKVKMIFREKPLHGPTAAKAAETAMCANESGKYLEMAEKLFANPADWQSETDPTAKFTGYAQELGIDITDCLKSGKHTADVTTDNNDGTKAGVNGTPTFFVNGTPIVGAQGYNDFKKIIDAELQKI